MDIVSRIDFPFFDTYYTVFFSIHIRIQVYNSYVYTILPLRSKIPTKAPTTTGHVHTRFINKQQTEKKGDNMDVIEKGEMKVVGMEIDTSVQECIENNKCPGLWEDFMKRASEIKNRKDEKVCLGASKVTGECSFKYIACVEVTDFEDIPEGMVQWTIPASKYAVYTHKGKVINLSKTYAYLYEKVMPQSGLKQKDVWIEHYDERFKEDSDDSEMDILISVE